MTGQVRFRGAADNLRNRHGAAFVGTSAAAVFARSPVFHGEVLVIGIHRLVQAPVVVSRAALTRSRRPRTSLARVATSGLLTSWSISLRACFKTPGLRELADQEMNHGNLEHGFAAVG